MYESAQRGDYLIPNDMAAVFHPEEDRQINGLLAVCRAAAVASRQTRTRAAAEAHVRAAATWLRDLAAWTGGEAAPEELLDDADALLRWAEGECAAIDLSCATGRRIRALRYLGAVPTRRGRRAWIDTANEPDSLGRRFEGWLLNAECTMRTLRSRPVPACRPAAHGAGRPASAHLFGGGLADAWVETERLLSETADVRWEDKARQAVVPVERADAGSHLRARVRARVLERLLLQRACARVLSGPAFAFPDGPSVVTLLMVHLTRLVSGMAAGWALAGVRARHGDGAALDVATAASAFWASHPSTTASDGLRALGGTSRLWRQPHLPALRSVDAYLRVVPSPARPRGLPGGSGPAPREVAWLRLRGAHPGVMRWMEIALESGLHTLLRDRTLAGRLLLASVLRACFAGSGRDGEAPVLVQRAFREVVASFGRDEVVLAVCDGCMVATSNSHVA